MWEGALQPQEGPRGGQAGTDERQLLRSTPSCSPRPGRPAGSHTPLVASGTLQWGSGRKTNGAGQPAAMAEEDGSF